MEMTEARRVFGLLLSVRAAISQYISPSSGEALEMCHCCFRTAKGLFLEVSELEGFVRLRIWSPWGGLLLAVVSTSAWNAVCHIIFALIGSQTAISFQPREGAWLYPVRRAHLPFPVLCNEEDIRNEKGIKVRAAEWKELCAAQQQAA
ncbi:MAG: hypothetical protein A2940_02485 [Candidatus Wildermuthbacteria bacterium RIFCSPLOWO2_01_FULL_48_29]|uniref:Uncharacterized protein n=2 Tax=Candidatus Wildermuthiibacteriota TaxID=1817923 RepID=A0A1G2RL26_9BACT|nr:MAG: hypothetical protein A2843_00530 [Candidatus Wildermuthbacteria bacterium RIFCSPHIGHO2_01_FULL_48_27b]OHA73550.1 MAG: hypothetical protein A2940_02485 [Candidatus Wildermuthbacteria bacterium RIFCSPLOWO2_01_FULL_48_29]